MENIRHHDEVTKAAAEVVRGWLNSRPLPERIVREVVGRLSRKALDLSLAVWGWARGRPGWAMDKTLTEIFTAAYYIVMAVGGDSACELFTAYARGGMEEADELLERLRAEHGLT